MVFKHSSEDHLEGEIISLGEYRPWSFHKENGGNGSDWPQHSSRTLGLKKKEAAALAYFFEYMVEKVKKPTAIAVVPSHSPATGPTTGVHILARQIAKALGKVDASDSLIRHTEINKLASGGDRSIERHLQSVSVPDPKLVQGQHVLLLDDVTTSGNSLLACRRILLEAGAVDVKMVALARTTH